MKNKKILSLIIPVFNAEKYLRPCLDSILSQHDNSLEIIIIDDGSIDSSPNIIEHYTKNHEIKVIRQNNSGVSAARNMGLKISTGDYIAFIDSDDIWVENIYQTIKESIFLSRPDLISFNYQELVDNKKNNRQFIKKDRLIKNAKNHDKLDILKRQQFYLWMYIFKRNLFEGIYFDNGRRFEDQLIFPILLDRAKKIHERMADIIYYRKHQASITHNLQLSDLDDSEFGILRFKEKYLEGNKLYWAFLISSLYLSHVSKCARLSYTNKIVAFEKNKLCKDIVPLSCILKSFNLKSIVYYLFNSILFKRLIKSVKNEVKTK